jgi:DNA repair exonuclease SbcCD ATPase subunit
MPPTTTKEAEKNLEDAIRMEQDVAGELAAIEKQLSESESTAGERCLAARKAGDQKAIQKINDEILKLRQRCDVTRSTHEASRQAIKEARHEINQARGRVLRAEAAKINEDVGNRQKKTDDLLMALFDHEGIRYIPEPQTRGGACLAGTYAESRTVTLAIQAQALIRQAEITENQVVRVEPDPSRDGRVSSAVKV